MTHTTYALLAPTFYERRTYPWFSREYVGDPKPLDRDRGAISVCEYAGENEILV